MTGRRPAVVDAPSNLAYVDLDPFGTQAASLADALETGLRALVSSA